MIVSPNFQSSLGGIRTEILRAMFDQNFQNVWKNDEWATSLYILSNLKMLFNLITVRPGDWLK